MTKGEVAAKVREAIGGRRPGGVSLEVIESAIERVEDWWRVPVRPSAWPEKRYTYYEELADIEEELNSQERLNVLITTDVPVAESAA
jgi:hypothetical protein